VDASHHPGHLEPHVRATAGTRTRSAALATPCASVLTPRSHRERPERGSNPRHRCERPASWPTRRPGHVEHGRKESNPLRRCWRPPGRHVLVRKIELLGRDSNHASFGSEPKILPLDDRGMSCDGWGRTSVVRVTAGCPAIKRRRIVSPPAWIRTTTGPGLSRMPLPVGLRGDESPRSGSNRQPSAYKAAALPG
jgi:hypothetical protein